MPRFDNTSENEIGLQEALESFRERVYRVGKADGAKALAEAIMAHYPHTVSIQHTVDKELLKYLKGLYD